MTIRVTSDQVDNARLLIALDRARGRESEEWIERLARATSSTPAHSEAAPSEPTIQDLDARLRLLEATVARLRSGN